MPPHGIWAVSYTHLDVYKRQAYNSLGSNFSRIYGNVIKIYAENVIALWLDTDNTVCVESDDSDNIKIYRRRKYASVLMVSVITCLLYTSRCV